jgi:acyl-CoA dehydrogenase
VTSILWFVIFLATAITLTYRRENLKNSTIAFAVLLLIYSFLGSAGGLWKLILWVVFAGLAFLNLELLRRQFLTRPILNIYRKMLPSMSDTEREALEAGTVWWDGELFTGMPDWNKLMEVPAPRLTQEEQAFLDGPCETLCQMINDWEITHEQADIPEPIWQYILDNGFFAMIIPKQYGGLGFSASANSAVLIKLASRSVTVSSTVGVPNSLGPAELLLHYGTEEQKNHYLPGLAKGSEIPCFALTAPRAGSDAAAIPDTGVVCKGTFNGEEIVGIRLNWDKRYITLAPVATVLGLAFKMYDPDHLIGDAEDYGITAALIPTDTEGVVTGRRHFPLNTPFQNGPTQGKDVFVPLDYIIGGQEMAGQGWRMLVELLSVGRCITLPSTAVGGSQVASYASGAYSRVRKQFNTSVSNFQGVEEALARIAGNTYLVKAATAVTAGAVDIGEKPSVPSAILKYHCTDLGRKVTNDAMDVHGGKGIMLGPNNYLGRGYQALPIAITVEGANILTRSLMIFGQGAIRCHPYILKEMNAAKDEDQDRGLNKFDRYLFKHIGYAISNASRAFVMATTHARYSSVPMNGRTKRYYQHINRYSSAFALVADAAMLCLGGELKKLELLSARLGDVFSSIYLASCVLKHYENEGATIEDLPMVEWACRSLLYNAQEQLHQFLRNFPNRPVAALLRLAVFPRGRTYFAPSDELGHEVAKLITHVTSSRDRLCNGIYKTQEEGNPMGQLQAALLMAEEMEPLESKLRKAVKGGKVANRSLPEQIDEAVQIGVLEANEAARLHEYDRLVMAIVAVDDFSAEDLGRGWR